MERQEKKEERREIQGKDLLFSFEKTNQDTQNDIRIFDWVWNEVLACPYSAAASPDVETYY